MTYVDQINYSKYVNILNTIGLYHKTSFSFYKANEFGGLRVNFAFGESEFDFPTGYINLDHTYVKSHKNTHTLPSYHFRYAVTRR